MQAKVAGAAAVLACPACGGELRSAGPGAACVGCTEVFAEHDGILDLRTAAPAAAAFDPHHFPGLHRVEDRHFWFVARREAILDGLRRSVPDLAARALIDVGCGSGGLLAYLRQAGVPVAAACDAHFEALQLTRSRAGVPLALVDEGGVPALRPGRTLIGLFDVLEHLDDDRAALQTLRDALAPGGILVITVPCHPFLFSVRDVQACHRRRYTRPGLARLLEGAGLQVRSIGHFMTLLVPALAVVVLAERLAGWLGSSRSGRRDVWQSELRVVPGLNRLMLGMLRLERRWARLVPLPFGASLLAVAARPGEGL